MPYCKLQLLYILSMRYESTKVDRLEEVRARGDVMGPEEQGAGMWRCYFWTSLFLGAINPMVCRSPRQQLKASRGMSVTLWKEGERRKACDRIM